MMLVWPTQQPGHREGRQGGGHEGQRRGEGREWAGRLLEHTGWGIKCKREEARQPDTQRHPGHVWWTSGPHGKGSDSRGAQTAPAVGVRSACSRTFQTHGSALEVSAGILLPTSTFPKARGEGTGCHRAWAGPTVITGSPQPTPLGMG